MLTLTEAAKETGLTRSAVFKAIKSGKLSAAKDENGHFQIDPAELFRVYAPVNKQAVSSEREETEEIGRETRENSVLSTKLEAMGELLKQVQDERDDLRRRLDEEATDRRQSAEEIRRLTLLLTHQPEGKGEPLSEVRGEAMETQAGNRGNLSPWVWLFVGAGLVAAASAAFVSTHPEFFPWTLP